MPRYGSYAQKKTCSKSSRTANKVERWLELGPAFVTKCLTLTCAAVILCGCGKPTAHYQRFAPLSHQPESLKGDAWQGTYALDTKTGQLCVTFDPSAFNSVSAIPTCLKLYRDFPD